VVRYSEEMRTIYSLALVLLTSVGVARADSIQISFVDPVQDSFSFTLLTPSAPDEDTHPVSGASQLTYFNVPVTLDGVTADTTVTIGTKASGVFEFEFGDTIEGLVGIGGIDGTGTYPVFTPGTYSAGEVNVLTEAGSPDYPLYIVDVSTSPVTAAAPEPSSLALLGTAVLGLAGIAEWSRMTVRAQSFL
jgi:hypothetical protein